MSAMMVTCKQVLKEGRKKAFNPSSKSYLEMQPHVVEPVEAFLFLALNFSSATD